MVDFFGKLHLLLLHLPIGLLGFAFLLELLARLRKDEHYRQTAQTSLSFGAFSALLAALTGWLLSRQGGYDEALLQKHQWLGFATVAASLVCLQMRTSNWYFPLLSITGLLLILAGHYGGSLTHGEGFLFSSSEKEIADKEPKQVEKPDSQTVVYKTYIQPILERKCASCHNPNKKKGDLLLDTPENMLRGGKNGPVLMAGKPDESPLLKRALLPLHHDDHMPPAGKTQLTEREIKLLRWWIEQGADPAKTWGQMAVTADIEAIFSTPPAFVNPVFSLDVEEASASDIAHLRAQGVFVAPRGLEQPFLSVSLAGNHKLDAELLAGLKSIAPQIVHLDLSNSNLSDPLCGFLDALPNLTRLNLAHTNIGNGVAAHIGHLQYLDYLNLVQTGVSDAVVDKLAGLKNLRSLYLWQTAISAQKSAQLTAALPDLRIDSGAPRDTNSAPLPLRPPKILFGRNIFEDTVRVSFDFPKMVDVHYAFNEASPTTQSPVFDGNPLILNQSTKVRALAMKTGWANSPVVEASFVKRKYRIREAQLARAPNPKYPGDGAKSLIDGRISDNYQDRAYIAYEGDHLDAVLDMGETIEFTRLSAHCVENNASWIFLPRGLQVWTSQDAKNWKPCIRVQYPPNSSMQDARAALLTEKAPAPVQCRYLKVRVESLLKNPKWHPGAGQKCWVFVDELLVE